MINMEFYFDGTQAWPDGCGTRVCRGGGEGVSKEGGRLQAGPDGATGLLGTEGRDVCISNIPSVPAFTAWLLLGGVGIPGATARVPG